MDKEDNYSAILQLKAIIAEQRQKILELENIIAQLPCNVFWKNKEGYYLGASDNLIKITKRDIIGKKVSEIIPKEFADMVEKNDKEVIHSAKTKVLEEPWVDSNGDPAVYLSHKIPLFNSTGEVSGLLGVALDITDRKKMELELKKTKELAEQQGKITHIYLNNLVANLPENFYWIDKESRVLGCNENQANMLGLTCKELIGKNVYDIGELLGWDKDVADEIRKNDLNVMQTRQVNRIEENIIINGEKKTYLSYKYPMIDDQDQVIGLFGVGIDITQRKHMEEALLIAKEQAELANQAKSEFIANMSHDIRTPFSGILSVAQILQKNEPDSKKKEMLGYITESSEKLLNLLNEILELARLAQDTPTKSIKFNPHQVAEQVLGILLAEIKFKNLDLEVDINPALPNTLLGDKLKLHRILLNLISNAVKFTAQGYITLRMNVASQHAENLILRIQIEDTGVGIPKDQYDTIFEHFNRLNPSYQGNYSGFGLGLYTVKEYITQMGGTIEVSSEIGKGSIFTCLLPFRIVIDEPSLNEKNQPNQAINTAHHKKNILLIEDDRIAQKVSKMMLEDYFGCEVDIAENGERALLMITNKTYDSIIMDIGLPDINGYNLTKKIRALGGKYLEIPIFGLTAHAAEANSSLSEEATMNIILTKPISEEICHKIFSAT